LDGRRNALIQSIADLSRDIVPPEQIERISGYLENWDNVSFDDKRQVLDRLVFRISATHEKVNIKWKI